MTILLRNYAIALLTGEHDFAQCDPRNVYLGTGSKLSLNLVDLYSQSKLHRFASCFVTKMLMFKVFITHNFSISESQHYLESHGVVDHKMSHLEDLSLRNRYRTGPIEGGGEFRHAQWPSWFFCR